MMKKRDANIYKKKRHKNAKFFQESSHQCATEIET